MPSKLPTRSNPPSSLHLWRRCPRARSPTKEIQPADAIWGDVRGIHVATDTCYAVSVGSRPSSAARRASDPFSVAKPACEVQESGSGGAADKLKATSDNTTPGTELFN